MANKKKFHRLRYEEIMEKRLHEVMCGYLGSPMINSSSTILEGICTRKDERCACSILESRINGPKYKSCPDYNNIKPLVSTAP
jgi:hypothetical protein